MVSVDVVPRAEVERLVALARQEGATHERARIAAIMSSSIAHTNMALAWALAAGGDVTLTAANEALALSLVAALPAPAGDSGLFLEH